MDDDPREGLDFETLIQRVSDTSSIEFSERGKFQTNIPAKPCSRLSTCFLSSLNLSSDVSFQAIFWSVDFVLKFLSTIRVCHDPPAPP